MSFDEGLCCGSKNGINLFHPKVAFGHDVLISAVETLTKTISKKDDIQTTRKWVLFKKERPITKTGRVHRITQHAVDNGINKQVKVLPGGVTHRLGA